MAQTISTTNKDVKGQKSFAPGLEKNPDQDYKTRHAITIGKSPHEVFTFFRDFRNLPFFMKDLTSIQTISETRSHWTVQVKNGAKVEWDADITGELLGRSISWASVEGSEVETSGQVTFELAPGERGTVVSLAMNYTVPGGKLTEFALFFTGESPDLLVQTNLKRLKAYMETGEIPTVEGQPSGRDEDSETLKH
jgi:uncharacterized membrane protein